MKEFKKYNVIIIFDKTSENILMCLRSKDPYKGLYNLVGGKIEEGEAHLASAYRELKEETGITKEDINLTHLMDFVYHIDKMELKVYYGSLDKEITLVEEVNKLFWISKNENFFNVKKFAGGGNIGHMLAILNDIKY